MNLSSIHLTRVPLLITVVASVFLAELAGYGLHRLMHSGRIPVLSLAHLIHHLLLYAPRQSMRTLKYKDATLDRASIGNVAMEWILPSVLILGFCWSNQQRFEAAVSILGAPGQAPADRIQAVVRAHENDLNELLAQAT